MRRASTLAFSTALRQALLPSYEGGGSIAAIQNQSGLLQAAFYGTTPATTSSAGSRQWFHSITGGVSARFVSLGLAGALVSVAGVSSLFEEVHAKETLPPNIVPKDVLLFQYESCPFCNKVKAFLDYYDIPYEVVEVNPISKTQIKWSDDYQKVPILMVDGVKLVDSSAIIDQMWDRISPEKSVIDDEEVNKWRQWVDNHLVHVLSPNIYRNTSEALESFDYITSYGNFSSIERFTVKYGGAAAMYLVSKKLKKKYNITDERAALYEAADTWVNALDGRDFLGGSKPSLADLAVFGVLRPIRNLQSGRDMVEHTRIGDWYARMESAVGESSRIKQECVRS